MRLVSCIDDWTKSLDRGFFTAITIFSFFKAFDSVPHCHLFSKLNQYCICGTVQNWLHSFLSDQYQRVLVNGAESSWLPVLSGVPQGTIFGPLLFLIYINDIDLGIDSEIRLFADDYILYREICNSCDSASLKSDQPNFARSLAISWAGTLHIHFRGCCLLIEFCQVQNSLCVPSLAFCYIGSVTARYSNSGVSQNLRCHTRNLSMELSQWAPPIFGWAAITLGISPHYNYLCSSVKCNDFRTQ